MRKKIACLLLTCLFLLGIGFSLAEESTVRVCGLSFPADAQEINLTGAKRTTVSQLSAALNKLPNLHSVYMWDWPMQREDKITLHKAFPEIFFGWNIQLNTAHRLRTDATSFSTLGQQPLLSKGHLVNFTFCPNLRALDLGHCLIKDISFLQDCAALKVLILADTGLTDISALTSQPELEYLELFHNKIKDISPLASLTQLKDVNLAYNDVTDLSPLYDLPNLERVWLMCNYNLSDAEVERLREHQPDCEIVTYSWGATGNQMEKRNGELVQFPGTSWRDHPRYDTIYYIFNGGEYIGWDDPIPETWQKK